MATKVTKVRPRSAAARQTVPRVEAVSPGDTVEFSITAEVKTKNGRSFWCKGGLSSTVREGEGTEDAKSRVASFVIDYVNEQVKEYLR